jgi:butyrate kinase
VVAKAIESGERFAALIFDAMIYRIGKTIGTSG